MSNPMAAPMAGVWPIATHAPMLVGRHHRSCVKPNVGSFKSSARPFCTHYLGARHAFESLGFDAGFSKHLFEVKQCAQTDLGSCEGNVSYGYNLACLSCMVCMCCGRCATAGDSWCKGYTSLTNSLLRALAAEGAPIKNLRSEFWK